MLPVKLRLRAIRIEQHKEVTMPESRRQVSRRREYREKGVTLIVTALMLGGFVSAVLESEGGPPEKIEGLNDRPSL